MFRVWHLGDLREEHTVRALMKLVSTAVKLD